MKKYNAPKIEFTEMIKGGMLCASDTNSAVTNTDPEVGGGTITPSTAPRRRVF